MSPFQTLSCSHCLGFNLKAHKVYQTQHNGIRHLYKCLNCKKSTSETWGTPMAQLNSPLSKVAGVIRVRSEGLGLRATGRVFGVHKKTVSTWETKFSKQKKPLMLYAMCHQFINLTFEGDELYTIVNKRTKASHSDGWTAVIMERSSRFIAEQRCGERNQEMFQSVMKTVAAYVTHSQDLTFLSDGERRYGNTLFDLCAEKLRNGKQGRPPRTLPEGVKLRLKNKGSQKSKLGRKRPKYEAPKREHPNTIQNLKSSDIQANRLEAQNAALRRRNSAFRRRTNTYAKNTAALQRTLDVHQIIHNFTRVHWTTGKVPAVAIGLIKEALSLENILTLRIA